MIKVQFFMQIYIPEDIIKKTKHKGIIKETKQRNI